MAEAAQTNYEVAAWLRLKGNFPQEMARATASISSVERGLLRAETSAARMGHQLMAGPLDGMRQMVRMAGILAGAAGAAAVGGMVSGGLRFNKFMEDAQLQLATMFQMFGIADSYIGEAASATEKWSQNMGLARNAMDEFLVLQAQTPAGAADLVKIYSVAAAGISQATDNVKEHTQFIAEWSVLLGALDGDVTQLGADLGRMLTGQAGMEVRTWQIFRSQIQESAKATKVMTGDLRSGTAFVQEWNRSLTAEQRLKVLRHMIAQAGPELREAFGESMSGLLSTTRATMDSLKGVLTQPLYEEFRQFLKRTAFDVEGLFSPESLREWMGILSYFGSLLAEGGRGFLSWIESGINAFRENWYEIANTVYKSFQAGALLVKSVVATALVKLAAGAALSVASKGIGIARRGVGMATGVIEGTAAMRQAASSVAGSIGMMTGVMGTMVGGVGTLTLVLLPAIAALGALGLALGFVAVIGAGIAAYLVENWNQIRKSISAAMIQGRESINAVIVEAYKLWYGLVAIGEVVLGTTSSADVLRGALEMMKGAIDFVTSSIIFLLEAGMAWKNFVADFKHLMADFLQGLANLKKFMFEREDPETKWLEETAKSWRAAGGEAASAANKIGEIKTAFESVQAKQLADLPTDIQARIEAAQKKSAKFAESLAAGHKKKKVPTSGVHVENMYNQWDLRNTDPDRLMGAFMPKLEQLADKRVQSVEQLDQGV